jgi:transcription antitermination factor NusG
MQRFPLFAANPQTGTQVRLAAGPFAKQLGTLDRLGDSGRVRVLLEILVELFRFSSNANS